MSTQRQMRRKDFYAVSRLGVPFQSLLAVLFLFEQRHALRIYSG